jgi:2-polyprenyl-3-methyl-5-hydroxy-6-metoxy-1,4-benzoquinol methylase
MWPDLTQRSTALELMDDRSIGGEELVGALRELRVINRWLGSAWPTLEGVLRLWRRAGQPPRLTILDIGAGSGDINRLLLAWAARWGVAMHITLVDIHPETCAAAAAYYRDEPCVQVVCSDLLRLGTQSADIVTAALFTHHFPSDQLPDVFGALTRAARIGVVVNDLHRHTLAWAGIWVATRLFSNNRMIRHDGPLSVRRGFRPSDLDQLRAEPGLGALTYAWRPFFRYLITIPVASSIIEADVVKHNA